jgi:hypothetical protein
MVKCSAARAYNGAARRVRVIGHGEPYDLGQIELTVAVCMGTRELEESPCRWIELMGLGCWRMRAGPFERELEPQLLNGRECRA